MICEYPLGEQEIEQNITVSRKAIASTLVGQGKIPYSLVRADNTALEVGSSGSFEIVPGMTDAYYASLVECTVYDANDDTKNLQVYPSCPSFLNVVQNESAASQDKLVISFVSFRFNSDDGLPEQQELK